MRTLLIAAAAIAAVAAAVAAVATPAAAHDNASPLSIAVRGDTLIASWTVGRADAAELREQFDRDQSGALDAAERRAVAEFLAERVMRAVGVAGVERVGDPVLELSDAVTVTVTLRAPAPFVVRPNTGDPRHDTRVVLFLDSPLGATRSVEDLDIELRKTVAELVGLGEVFLLAGLGAFDQHRFDGGDVEAALGRQAVASRVEKFARLAGQYAERVARDVAHVAAQLAQ